MVASPHTFFLSARTVALSYGNLCIDVLLCSIMFSYIESILLTLFKN